MRMPRRTWMVLASASCLSLAAVTLRAEPDQPAEAGQAQQASAKGAETYQQIMQEYQTAQQSFSEAYRAAKDDAERQKIVEEKYPRPEKFSPRLLAFADKNPDDPQALDALLFVVGMSRGGDDMKKALDQVVGRYVTSERVGPIVQRLGFSSGPEAEAALTKILDQNPSRGVKGQACYSLGQYYLNSGKPAEAEKRFEEVVANYADVNGGYRGTLGDAAKAQLFEARNLVVGKTAPEIEGEDVDGKKFKLSDYRGKVVVLDFWGDW